MSRLQRAVIAVQREHPGIWLDDAGARSGIVYGSADAAAARGEMIGVWRWLDRERVIVYLSGGEIVTGIAEVAPNRAARLRSVAAVEGKSPRNGERPSTGSAR